MSLTLDRTIICSKYNEQLQISAIEIPDNNSRDKLFIFQPLQEKPIRWPPTRMHANIYFSDSKKEKFISTENSDYFNILRSPCGKNKKIYTNWFMPLNYITVSVKDMQIENINLFVSYNFIKKATNSQKIHWFEEGF